MARRAYSDETKAQVMAALLTGQSINSVAKDYKISKSTASLWKQKAIESVRCESNPKNDESSKLDEMLFAYAEANLVTLREQAVFFRNVKWLDRQSAAEAAVLHGVIADKTIRVLEAWENAHHDDGETGDAGS